VAEPPKRAGRSDFERDRARVLHSAALRRLAAKTQVVRATSADFPRTRLTHSLECAQIGRELGQEIGCDPDLVDAACLAHDIGHSPFGHNGEAALNELAAGIGGFEGNAQTLRLLTRLEPKTEGAGLNLTRATLDATLKYPWFGEPGTKFGAYAEDAEVFAWIRQGAPDRRPCLEAQVMDWADDVAYSVHDMEDGFHAGLVTVKNLKSPTERAEVSRTAIAYCPDGVTEAELTELLEALLALDIWPASYDGGPATVAALKNLTSELIGRFCVAAQQATLAAASESAPHPTTATSLTTRLPWEGHEPARPPEGGQLRGDGGDQPAARGQHGPGHRQCRPAAGLGRRGQRHRQPGLQRPAGQLGRQPGRAARRARAGHADDLPGP